MVKKKIIIAARYGGYGGAYNLNRAINKCSYLYSSELIVSQCDPYSFGDGIIISEDNIDYIDYLLENSDYIFICDITGIHPICKYLSILNRKKIISKMKKNTICEVLRNKILLEWVRGKNVFFYWTGSIYREKYRCINEWEKLVGSKGTFAMCDLTRFKKGSIPLMQTYDLSSFPYLEKNREFTVVHYLGECGRGIEKKVQKKLRKNGILLKQLRGVPFKKFLSELSRSHLFIDQITGLGGIGKAALEAMIMGIPVLGDISKSNFDGYYEGCPVVQVNVKILSEQITNIIKSGDYKNIQTLNLEWSRKISFKSTVEYLEKSMGL
jgi:hypothetical protein